MNACVTPRPSLWAFIREGLVYAVRTPAVRLLLIVIGLVSLFSAPYTVLMPVFAEDILHGGPSGMGVLMGAAGLGAVVGVSFLARHRGTDTLGRAVVFALLQLGLGLILFALSRKLWLSVLILPLVGSGFMVPLAAVNTLLQTIAPDHLRGRIMSLFFIMFMGASPVGSLLSGSLAPYIGAPLTVGLTGLSCLGAAVWLSLNLHLLQSK